MLLEPRDRIPTPRLSDRLPGRRFAPVVILGWLPLALCACITPPEPIPWESWRSTYPPDDSLPLEEKARRIERHLREHHWSREGVLVYRRPCAPCDGEVLYANVSDETLHTGLLVAALGFKYAATGAPEDRNALLAALDGLRLLHDVTGVEGLFARAIHPADVPVPGEEASQEWRSAPPPHERLRYRGDVSKDQYFGVLFGYASVAAELGIDAAGGDSEIRERMAPVVAAIADHVWRHGLNIVDADGSRTKHGDLGGYFLGIVPVGPNAQLSLGFQLLAHRLCGASRFAERYEELLRRGYAEATALNKFELLGETNHNNDHMAMMGLHALTSLERREDVLGIYEQSLRRLWRLTRHEGNAFYHLVAASSFTLPPFARFDVRENLRLFPVDPTVHSVNLADLDHPAIERHVFENRFGNPRNRTALPVHLRYRGALAWTKCPFALVHVVKDSGRVCVSGVDYLLAYWMARRRLGDPERLCGDSMAAERDRDAGLSLRRGD